MGEPGTIQGGIRADTTLDGIVRDLNTAQGEAARAATGPVVILAGAGTGKTTTITHRIAYQVATGTFAPEQIMAVTFTQKAAGELKERLAGLGVQGVVARTFHAAALAQLRSLWQEHTGEPLPEVLDHKSRMIASLANGLPPPYKFLPRREFASEIEWAKNRRIEPAGYPEALEGSGHTSPVPVDLMTRIFRDYERRKEHAGLMDFEDMLALTVRLFDEHPDAVTAVRERFAAFTVDEYQDVNPLQAALLQHWLGDREEICVVGDDYQTIYAFTGASPEHLLSFPERYPDAKIIRLEQNYRSTPQVLAMANRLAPKLGGFDKRLVATRPGGSEPSVRSFPDLASECAWVVKQAQRLHAEGVTWEEMAVLYRINARSEPLEEAFAECGIPYQVRDGAFLRRPGARSVLARLRREPDTPGELVATIERITTTLGYAPGADTDSIEEATRQSDLGRMRAIAAEFDAAHDGATLAGFVADLPRRFSAEESGRGVNLLTYHRAKGLEFDAVFLPRLLDGELPFRSGRSIADPEEERRLLYVGITRARRHLTLTWPTDARAGRSPFLTEATGQAEPVSASGRQRATTPGPPVTSPSDGPLFDRLKAWRKERANADGVPAYVVFHDRTLVAIAEARPSTSEALLAIEGIGPAKLDRYAHEVLDLVASTGR